MFKTYQVTIPAGGVARCSDAYGLNTLASDYNREFAKADIPQRQLTFQVRRAGSNAMYIGDTASVSANIHGFALDATDTVLPVILGPFGESGPMKLSDFYVAGTAGDVLVIGAVPF